MPISTRNRPCPLDLEPVAKRRPTPGTRVRVDGTPPPLDGMLTTDSDPHATRAVCHSTPEMSSRSLGETTERSTSDSEADDWVVEDGPAERMAELYTRAHVNDEHGSEQIEGILEVVKCVEAPLRAGCTNCLVWVDIIKPTTVGVRVDDRLGLGICDVCRGHHELSWAFKAVLGIYAADEVCAGRVLAAQQAQLWVRDWLRPGVCLTDALREWDAVLAEAARATAV